MVSIAAGIGGVAFFRHAPGRCSSSCSGALHELVTACMLVACAEVSSNWQDHGVPFLPLLPCHVSTHPGPSLQRRGLQQIFISRERRAFSPVGTYCHRRGRADALLVQHRWSDPETSWFLAGISWHSNYTLWPTNSVVVPDALRPVAWYYLHPATIVASKHATGDCNFQASGISSPIQPLPFQRALGDQEPSRRGRPHARESAGAAYREL